MESFPRRDPRPRPVRLSEIAELVGGAPEGDADPELTRVAPLDEADASALSIVAARRYVSRVVESGAGALVVAEGLVELLPDEERRPRVVVDDVHVHLARILDHMHPERPAPPEIHATAVLGPGVKLGSDVRVGPYAVVEAGAVLDDGVVIGAHCVVGAGARVGSGSVLHPHVVVYPGVEVGRGVILHAGVRLGVDGFGYAFHEGEHRKVPQVGGCRIGDHVEIGANTTIDRGSIGDTTIGEGTKIDNLVQVGHNVTVGARSILVSQVGVAGSAELGRGVVAAGQVGIAGHIHVGDGAVLAARAGIMGDVPAGATYMGFPGRPRGEFLRATAAQRKVPDLVRRVQTLERELARLRDGAGDPT